MKKPKINMSIIKEGAGYSAHALVGNISINTQGDNFAELKEGIIGAVNLSFEDQGFTYAFDEIQLSYELKSFFEFYKVINAKALSERIGMNQSLLAQYIKGIKTPSQTQVQRILQGVHQLGNELAEVKFIM